MSRHSTVSSKKSAELIQELGNPMRRRAAFERRFMDVWHVPKVLRTAIPCLPSAIFANRLIIAPLQNTLMALIDADVHKEIKTYDGCYNVRYQRGTENTTRILSRHSWGLAIDLNAATNPLGGRVTWTRDFLDVWREMDWTCGADWRVRVDGMHFEWNAFDDNDVATILDDYERRQNGDV